MKANRRPLSIQPIAVNNEDGTLRVVHPLLATRARRMTHWLATQLGVERPHDAGLWLLRVFIRPKKASNLTLQQVPDPFHLLATRLGVKNQRSLREWLLRTFFIAAKPAAAQELRLSTDADKPAAASQKTENQQRYAA